MSRPRKHATLTDRQTTQVVFESRIAFLGFFLHTATQFAHLNCPWHEKWQRLFSIPFTASVWLFPTLMPALYLKWREPFLFIFKVSFYAFPLLRKARGIQRVLDASATPGLLGAVLDVVKMAWGSRLFAVLSTGLGLPLSVWPQLIVQLYSILMIRGNWSLCQSQLMTDPITTRRVNVFSQMATGALQPSFSIGGQIPPGMECSFFFTVLHLFWGVLVPTLPLMLSRRALRSFYENRWELIMAWWIGMSAVSATATLATNFMVA